MGSLADQIGYRLLRFLSPRRQSVSQDSTNSDCSMPETNLKQLFGEGFFKLIEGKTVIDFGCGRGYQTVEMAQNGAAKVIGLDIQEHQLRHGKEIAIQFKVDDRCVFTSSTNQLADIIVSKDAFEHFSNPGDILNLMRSLLKPDGYVLAAFGPTWFHPYGGHFFSIFPWSHLIFSENSQIKWRSHFKTDGATTFSEVEGGLNQLTISRFERYVADSPFRLEWLETIPIKGISLFKANFLREIGSSIVRCKLSLK